LEQHLSAAWLALDGRRPLIATPITLVAIDETAIDRIGPWPWPRAQWAELLRRLYARHQPAVITLDVVFPADPHQESGNAAFGLELASRPAVIGQLLLPETADRGAMHWTPIHLADEQSRREAAAASLGFSGTLGNAPPIADAARAGHINAQLDPDGMMRHLPAILCLRPDLTQCSISLFQAMAGSLTGATAWELRRGNWWQAPWLLAPEGMPHLASPLDEKLRSLIPWRHPAGLNYVSAADIWSGSLPAGALDQQILLFGGVSLGLGDIATSPLQRSVPGMEVHGQLMRDWLQGQLPYAPRAGNAIAIGMVLLGALGLLANAHRPRRLWWLGTTLPLALLAVGAVLWWWSRAALPLAAPAAFIATAALLLLLRQALRERREILARIEPYLPEPLRRLLGNNVTRIPDETGWGTIMVADILGYTRQSQRLPLAQLAAWCDQGVDHIIQHARARGAMLDNVAGDGALLLWRNGTDMEQAHAACAAAQGILDELPLLNARLQAAGLPPLAIGIGIHAGPYLLGSFGRGRKRYTVVSEAANLAAHIERETRHHPWALLLSKTVAQALPRSRSRQVAVLRQEQGRDLPLYTLVHSPAYHWPSLDHPSTPTPSAP